MDFTLTDDQRAIADLAANIFAGGGDCWPALREAGMADLLLPEAAGGVGLGFVEMALVLVEQGRALAPAPVWRHALAVAATGEPSDALLTLTTEEVSPSGGHLSAVRAGEKLVVQAGGDLYLVDLAGLPRTEGVLTDGETASAIVLPAISSEKLPVDAAWLAPRAALCLVALQVGIAEGAIRRTADYVSTREQFGRPIGSFQAVAQRAADAFTDVEVARTMMFELAWKIDAGVPIENTAEVATWCANQCSHRVAHTAMHLHGGVGADVSFPIHRVLLWARAAEIELGGAARQLAKIGARLAA